MKIKEIQKLENIYEEEEKMKKMMYKNNKKENW